MKKGEITTQQIVLLIILLVSFIIILFLLLRLNLGKESDSDICHNSVVMRGNSVLPADAVPLKCSRTYICITKDGSCESMTKPEIIKVSTKDEVYSALAEQMANCWWMFGEGKVDYIGKDFFIRDNYCSICSQIAFDDSLREIKDEEGNSLFIEDKISEDEFYNYLSVTPIPDKGMNYAQYLFGTNDVNRLNTQPLKGEDGTEIVAGTFGTMDLNKKYFVLMGITSEIAGEKWKIVAGVGVAAAGFFIPGPGWTLAGSILGTLIINFGTEIGAIIVPGNGIKNNFMAPTIQEANSESLKKLNCYEIVTST
jgi:hypothetical protein